ncbi:NitT/TauT family transport system ATP-binding protein [Herbaspirillum sp. Sphag1AN]|uniref:ABC transporter ATP-binding protein n=1 Tax=unclassified Herbaspirillum TaxID=2624150 RepID=UPI00160A0207|nr:MULTISPECIES: ABC transporter ATP-binding protein [unclassified Herbaspirillum]MBB3213029.1 NitT/TauT family transport system ATP-binding protein [Herbaspirillum sp. Sphag1AN]MBB3246226.1 NitT/TauT family transport system ATP-binding protein [Herbaspirillum sp. Sphag64]
MMKRDDQAIARMTQMAQLMAAEAATADPDAVLNALRVEKTYRNGTRALDEVRLTIKRGEFVSLLGPSGCGKSTLLKMFAGLEEPSHGHIRWWGKNLATIGTEGHTLAMVFQEATLMPWASVEQNVRLPLDLQHMPRAESEQRVRDALKLVGLERFHQAAPRELSGGMQMRASIARALATQPNLLLMDEPFGALDEFTRNKLDADLRRIWSEQDLTVVFVTHSIYEAVYLSSRVVVMAARPGRIIADVPIEAPGAGGMRDDAFRMTPEFMGYCKILSDYLTLANREGGAHDALDH